MPKSQQASRFSTTATTDQLNSGMGFGNALRKSVNIDHSQLGPFLGGQFPKRIAA